MEDEENMVELRTCPFCGQDTANIYAAGNVLIDYTPAKSYRSVVVSCPGLVKGGSYTISACGQSSTVTLSSLIFGSGSGMGGGGQQPGGGMRPGRP